MAKKKRDKIIISIIIVSMLVIAVFLGKTYAFFKKSIEIKPIHLVVSSLNYKLMLNHEEMQNHVLSPGQYKVVEIELISENTIDSKYTLVYKQQENIIVEYFEENHDLPFGTIEKEGKKKIKLRLYNQGTEEKTIEIYVKGGLLHNDVEINEDEVEIKQKVTTEFKENILAGCDPVLSDNLIPVTIENDGTVHKADLYDKWYSYEDKLWANAVVLEDASVIYEDGEVIPEDNIESYFVWIPRYKYKIFNDTVYTGLTEIEDRVQEIEVEFENKDTTISNGTTTGSWLTHPAFTSFESNGFWVGKFESGYKGATSTETAQVNSADNTKLQIKPNIYSWRDISIGNAFKVSYDYLREDESHMMKNMEWGSVAYLQHSKYGSMTSVRNNNNSSYKTGYASISEPTLGYNEGISIPENLNGTTIDVTRPYNTEVGYTASTTGNISGIYDMSGGVWEYMMGYNTNANTLGGDSGLTNIYSDFFTNSKWEKYYDRYSNTEADLEQYQKGLLGDATREMGPFGNVNDPDNILRNRISWYSDLAYFLIPTSSWFIRGGLWSHGSGTGIFTFNSGTGVEGKFVSFRLVLTP